MIVLLLLLLLVALFAYLIWGLFASRKVPIRYTASLPWAPQDSAPHVVASVTPVMQGWGYRIDSQGPAAVVFANSYRPMWLAFPVIFLFPIGLLALLYKKTIEVSFNFVPVADGTTQMHVSGRGSTSLRDRLDAKLDSLQPAPRAV
ncbi:MAG: hypothetical protein QOI84_1886 [Solirubrobacterales bacterium]|nr:hypothetical protein [Solirubrobacterales bacterium]